MKRRVAIAMSGGIDSSAAAYLMKKNGFDCVGVFMKNWDSSDEVGNAACPINKDLLDAKNVCNRLDIPFHNVEFIKDYWVDVFQPFLDAYSSGTQTPNPDVFCNKHIKFDKLLSFVQDKLGIETLVTGHYCKIKHSDGLPQLYAAVDSKKDQSYFLSMTKGEKLKNAYFPLGDYTKQQVRELVAEPLKGLDVLDKKESMGICFIGKRNFRDFLSEYINISPGRFIDIDTNEVVGKHEGKELYTIGQGAKIKGTTDKYFVAKKTKGSSDILVARGSFHPALFFDTAFISCDAFSWISGDMPLDISNNSGSKFLIKFGSRQVPQLAQVDTVVVNNTRYIRCQCEKHSRVASPGQIAAIYRLDLECLGGGPIHKFI